VPNDPVTEVANKHLPMYQIQQYEDAWWVNYEYVTSFLHQWDSYRLLLSLVQKILILCIWRKKQTIFQTYFM
jgi:hypothetical protein